MTPEHIRKLIGYYKKEMWHPHMFGRQMDASKTFKQLTFDELIRHAYYLCENLESMLDKGASEGKVGRHLASIQMCLSFAGVYTLAQLMDHNRDDAWLK